MSTNWKLISLDVWGNEDDGFEVNAAYHTGITLSIDDHEHDHSVIGALRDGGYLADDVAYEDIDVDGDEYMMYITYVPTGEPLWHLEATDDPESRLQ